MPNCSYMDLIFVSLKMVVRFGLDCKYCIVLLPRTNGLPRRNYFPRLCGHIFPVFLRIEIWKKYGTLCFALVYLCDIFLLSKQVAQSNGRNVGFPKLVCKLPNGYLYFGLENVNWRPLRIGGFGVSHWHIHEMVSICTRSWNVSFYDKFASRISVRQ